MIKQRNWTVPVIISGIVFFTMFGTILSSEIFKLDNDNKVIIIYWSVGLFFTSFLCLPLLKKDFYKRQLIPKLETGVLFPVSLLYTAIMIKMTFYPVVIFILLMISWILWAISRSYIKGVNLSLINILIISWLVFSIVVLIGEVVGYSDVLISKIYGFNMFLDLRITLSIIIFTILIIKSFGKVDFSKIETKDLLSIDDKGNPLLIIIGLFYILVNFLIKIIWWLGIFIMLWGQEFVNELKKRFIENKNTLFDLAIIAFSIIGLFFILIFSNYLVYEYLSINNTLQEIIPFLKNAILVSIIFILLYLIIRFRNLNWNNWIPVINKTTFNTDDRIFRESLGFPILTSGIAGIALFALSKIESLQFEYFKNYGFFSLLLTLGLISAILTTIIKHLSKKTIENKK